MSSTPEIRLQGVSVEFPLFGSAGKELAETSEHDRRFRRNGKNVVFRALDGLDITIGSGERVGIWGRNGSGKTTLLRTLRGVYPPVEGELEVSGQVQSFLNMTFGMNDDASGWENILLRGVVMGATPALMRELSPRIAEFSELGEFLSLPLRRYSAGMRMRLAFSIAMELPSDIILMDEWLAVGDGHFRDKAADRLQNAIASSKILVVASHNINLLKNVCTRVIELNEGVVLSDRSIEDARLRESKA
ncbi:ABC transporter ATP-binding protein [Maricaulis maris]|jgi:lipopolysaccharide transport system ATP-binding protein|uniref:ABC transporter ATP-binding protein n=1 Tax=Maricaulis maris TaxID=74318 RepID=UPI003A940015